MRHAIVELVCFGLKEARACLFPMLFFGTLVVSRTFPAVGIARYDLIFLAALAIQALLLLFGFETLSDLFVLSAFHGLGLALELF